MQINAIAAPAPGKPLAPLTIEPRAPRAHDVVIEILFAGICHSDIHQARDEWGPGIFRHRHREPPLTLDVRRAPSFGLSFHESFPGTCR